MAIILSEGKRDEALGMFLPLFQKRGIEINISQLKQFLLNKFVTEAGIHALSQGSNFYLLGVARYYFNGELTKNSRLNALYPQFKDKFIPEVCQRLDAVVNILRGSYIDSVGTKFELPEDFGNLSLEALLKKYNKAINKELGIETAPAKKEVVEPKQKISQSTKVGRKYSYEILYSFEDAKKYKQYTEPGAWCITYGKQHYDGYIKRLKIHYVIFKKDGFENIPRKKGKNWTKMKPQDEYGNSLIALLQSNSTGEPVYITSRWNHGSSSDNSLCEADHAYTKEEFFAVTGCDDATLQRAFEQWKEKSKELGSKNAPIDRKELYAKKLDVLRTFKYAQMMINGGANIQDAIGGGIIIRDGKNYKGTYLVFIKKNEETWYTLMDRKQMFYDTYLTKASWSPSYLILSRDNNFTLLKDDSDRFYIFDHIHHTFVNIDGQTRFKDVSDSIKWSRGAKNERFIMLALSGNQIALLDLLTMKPIRARNGSGWFESITVLNVVGNDSNRNSRGQVVLPYNITNKVLKLVYDSASNEIYLFDTRNGRFIEAKNENGFVLSRRQRYSDIGFIAYVNGNEYQIGSGTKILIKLQRVSNGEWFAINGYDTFRDIDIDKSLIVGYKGYDEEMAHYVDGTTGKMLMINGKPLETPTVEMMSADSYIAISLSKAETGNFWLKVALFNPINRTMFHDNTSGWYFSVYGGVGPKVYYPNDRKNTYQLPNAEQAAQIVNQEKNNVTNKFSDMMNRMNR